MVSNQTTGMRSTAPASFLRQPLPLIDSATDAPRSIIEPIVKLANFIQHAINKKEHVITVIFYLEKAFD